MKDYYKILGVGRDATAEDIKKAYRKAAHQYHPDRQGGDAERFKEINEAYQVLSNQEKKRQYDRFGTTENSSFGSGPFGGFDFDMGGIPDMEDIFEMFFGGMGGAGTRRKSYRRGADLQYIAEITLEEAYRGIVKNIEYPAFTQCGSCSGKGYNESKGTKTCETCGGAGEIKESRKTFFGSFAQVKECQTCRGSGETPNEPCGTCGGNGRVKTKRKVAVEILPGVSEGQIIKVTGQGEAGERGAAGGDLYVRVAIKPNERFIRKGDDLLTTKTLSVLDLLLGIEMEIETVVGKKVQVSIPAGFNLKEPMTVPGEGMPRFGSWGYGNLIVSFEAVMPKKLSKKAKELLEKLKKEIE